MVLLVRAWERGDHSKFYDAHEIFVAEGVRGRGRPACENGGDKKSDVTMRQISGGGSATIFSHPNILCHN